MKGIRETDLSPEITTNKQKNNHQVPNNVRERLINMTQFNGVSVYKAHKLLKIHYSTAKQIVR